jgi:hypothetical protein
MLILRDRGCFQFLTRPLKTACPEFLEGLSFFCIVAKQGQPFDKLRDTDFL